MAYLKQAKPNIFSVHCVIHQYHLVAKNLSERLHGSLDYVIRAINRIKRNVLNERLFAQLCLENDEDYNLLLLNTEVRYLKKQNLGRGECSQFPNLPKLQKRDDDLLVYCQHLTVLHSDLSQRFEYILHLGIPDWVLDPFASRPTNSDEAILIQEELIELFTNEELKPMFEQGYHKFWLRKQIPILYPALWATGKKLLIAFPSSYLVEHGLAQL
ncbi:SCAN domain-containing protein 3-like [Centruroides sculpturatus]|uniref:SCAN domain-containing protein 3-like n=1 Tax=Centruroides sculpturatus TaxID=218467 RepID=UPI000C6D0284|nr:SCAN domain-containing protein 3-like [Centruroides sculpturatus]